MTGQREMLLQAGAQLMLQGMLHKTLCITIAYPMGIVGTYIYIILLCTVKDSSEDQNIANFAKDWKSNR